MEEVTVEGLAIPVLDLADDNFFEPQRNDGRGDEAGPPQHDGRGDVFGNDERDGGPSWEAKIERSLGRRGLPGFRPHFVDVGGERQQLVGRLQG